MNKNFKIQSDNAITSVVDLLFFFFFFVFFSVRSFVLNLKQVLENIRVKALNIKRNQPSIYASSHNRLSLSFVFFFILSVICRTSVIHTPNTKLPNNPRQLCNTTRSVVDLNGELHQPAVCRQTSLQAPPQYCRVDITSAQGNHNPEKTK